MYLATVSLLLTVNPVYFAEFDNNNPISFSSTPLHILPAFGILFIYLFVKVVNSKLLALIAIACLFYMLFSLSTA
jgi:quinol-cytochrome oxidoreductase complex cytochrome b subunit